MATIKSSECRQEAFNCPHARESAEMAVKKVFAILGVDIDKPSEVEEFRQNLRFGATMRRATDRGVLAVAAAVGVAVLAAIWSGVMHAVNRS